MNLWIKQARKGEARAEDMAAEFQTALVEVLVEKTIRAAKNYKASSILIAGGVAANQLLRQLMTIKSQQEGLQLFYPSLGLCTDNAAMIAGKAYFDFIEGNFAPLNINAHPGRNSL